MGAEHAAAFLGGILARRGSADLDLTNLGDAAIDWPATIRQANDAYACPALWTALREAGAAAAVPHDVRDYLGWLHAENARCNTAIREQCAAIGMLLKPLGLSAVLLKGAAWLFEEGPAGEDRMMRDIDLLLDGNRMEIAHTALLRAGYFPSPTAPPEEGNIHGAPLVHPDGLVSVELHRELTTRVRLLSGREVLADSSRIAPGLRMPSTPHRIIHNVIHAQIINGDFAAGVVGFRDLLDLSRLAQLPAQPLDWHELAATARRRGYFRELSGAVHKAARFTGLPLPEPFSSDPAGRRHAARCAWQRRFPVVDRPLRRFGVVRRALVWERDAYALGLESDRSLGAHLKVNRRRAHRLAKAVRRVLQRLASSARLSGERNHDASIQHGDCET